MTIGHALLMFTLAAGLLTIVPGLDTALVLRTAALEGSRRAMFAGLGICCGCLAWGFAASIGLGALLSASRFAYTALRVAGACYLIFLGTKMLLRKYSPTHTMDEVGVEAAREPGPGGSTRRWFVRGLLTNLLNPKVGVFYVTFLPQFIPAGVGVIWFGVLLAAIHATEGIIWFALLTIATRPLSRWLRRPRVASTLERATGAVLVGFGLRLALDHDR